MAIIAVDIDDVLVPFYQSLADWHNERTGSELHASQLTDNKLSESWDGDEKYWISQCNTFHSEGGSAALAIFDEAKAALERLATDHEVILLTSRPAMHREHTEGWMNRHLGHVTQTLIMCEQPTAEGSSRHMDKGVIAREAGAEVLIDDSIHYIRRSTDAGVRGILFGDYSWNKSGHEEHEHARDWAEVLQLLGYN